MDNFSEALEALKAGHKVARAGWNGKDMFVYLVDNSSISRNELRGNCRKHIDPISDDNHNIKICGHIDMKAADGSIVIGWLASQTDILAEDWTIV